MNSNAISPADAAFLKRVLMVIGVAAVVFALWLLSEILLLIFGSVLVAIILRSLAAPLARHLRMGERWALAFVGVVGISALVLAILWFGPELSQQIRSLSERLSTIVQDLAGRLELGSIADLFKGTSPASSLGTIVAGVFAWSSTLLGVVTGLLLVVFGGIYLAVDPQLYRGGFLKLVPPPVQPNIDAALEDAHEALRRWLGGQLIAMVLVGTLTGFGLWFVGLPSPFALGLIAGLAEFVPIIGPIAAAIPVLLVAMAQDWQTVVWAMGVVVIIQQTESNVITPIIIGSRVQVAPAVALFAIVVMGVLFGPLGLLFGFPLAIVFDVAVRRLYVQDTLGERVQIMGEPPRSG